MWTAGWLQTSLKENECILRPSTYYYKFQECAGELPAVKQGAPISHVHKHVPIRAPIIFIYAHN
jgi:hypothetical protein